MRACGTARWAASSTRRDAISRLRSSSCRHFVRGKLHLHVIFALISQSRSCYVLCAITDRTSMSNGNIREFRLAPPGSRRGVTCGADGAFVCGVSLLRRIKGSNDSTSWETRDGAILSSELSDAFGLPIDVASKSSGLSALAKHLNNGDVAHAQLVALLMKIPESEPPPDAPGHSRARFIDLIKALYSSGMLKTDWDPNLHPRWPAGSIDSQGGQFAPKNDDVGSDTRTSSNSESQEDFRPLDHNDLSAGSICGVLQIPKLNQPVVSLTVKIR